MWNIENLSYQLSFLSSLKSSTHQTLVSKISYSKETNNLNSISKLWDHLYELELWRALVKIKDKNKNLFYKILLQLTAFRLV